MLYFCKVIKIVGQVTDYFDFMMGKISIKIPDFGEATCVESVASLHVMSNFVPLFNC